MWWRLTGMAGAFLGASLGTLYAISNPGRAALHGTGDAASWIQAWWSIATLIIALVAPGLETEMQKLDETRRRHRAAAMLLTVGLRRWRTAVSDVVSDAKLWQQTDGQMGRSKSVLPEPKLDSALDRAPDLSTEEVQNILDAMAFRDRAQSGIDSEWALGLSNIDDNAAYLVEDGGKLMGLLDPIILRLEKASGFNWAPTAEG